MEPSLVKVCSQTYEGYMWCPLYGDQSALTSLLNGWKPISATLTRQEEIFKNIYLAFGLQSEEIQLISSGRAAESMLIVVETISRWWYKLDFSDTTGCDIIYHAETGGINFGIDPNNIHVNNRIIWKCHFNIITRHCHIPVVSKFGIVMVSQWMIPLCPGPPNCHQLWYTSCSRCFQTDLSEKTKNLQNPYQD